MLQNNLCQSCQCAHVSAKKIFVQSIMLAVVAVKGCLSRVESGGTDENFQTHRSRFRQAQATLLPERAKKADKTCSVSDRRCQ